MYSQPPRSPIGRASTANLRPSPPFGELTSVPSQHLKHKTQAFVDFANSCPFHCYFVTGSTSTLRTPYVRVLSSQLVLRTVTAPWSISIHRLQQHFRSQEPRYVNGSLVTEPQNPCQAHVLRMYSVRTHVTPLHSSSPTASGGEKSSAVSSSTHDIRHYSSGDMDVLVIAQPNTH